jgi:hypothetical protein
LDAVEEKCDVLLVDDAVGVDVSRHPRLALGSDALQQQDKIGCVDDLIVVEVEGRPARESGEDARALGGGEAGDVDARGGIDDGDFTGGIGRGCVGAEPDEVADAIAVEVAGRAALPRLLGGGGAGDSAHGQTNDDADALDATHEKLPKDHAFLT